MKGKKLYSVEVSTSSNNWFNFRAGSLTEAKEKIREIKNALRKLGVTLVNEHDVSVFKESPVGSNNRSFNIRMECPYCSDWFWYDLSEGRSCWIECPSCDERFMQLTLAELQASGATCSKCPDAVECLTISSAE